MTGERSPWRDLERHDRAMRLFFEGLAMHFFECAASGRIEDWRKAGHAAIDLICCLNGVEFARRAELLPPAEEREP